MPALTTPNAPGQMLVSVPTPQPVQQKQPKPPAPPRPPQASTFRRKANAGSLILPYPGAEPADDSKARASYRTILRAQPKQMQKKSEQLKRFGAEFQTKKPPKGMAYHQIRGDDAFDYAPGKPKVGSPFITKAPRIKIDKSVSAQDLIDTFGHVPHPHDLAAMSNGGDGLDTLIYKDPQGEINGATMAMSGTRHYSAHRVFSQDGTVHNMSFEKHPNSPIKISGSEAFRAQAEALAAHGFHTIETHAAGNPESMAALNRGEHGYIGYFVWPGLGFDGPLENKHIEALRANGIDLDPKEPNWIGDHLDDPKFADTWKHRAGTSIGLKFNLEHGSPSWERRRATPVANPIVIGFVSPR